MTEVSNDVVLIDTIENTLKTASKKSELSSPITMQSAMHSPSEWDSLSFVAIFLAVHEAFDLEPEDDDAIHFMSVEGISTFLKEVL